MQQDIEQKIGDLCRTQFGACVNCVVALNSGACWTCRTTTWPHCNLYFVAYTFLANYLWTTKHQTGFRPCESSQCETVMCVHPVRFGITVVSRTICCCPLHSFSVMVLSRSHVETEFSWLIKRLRSSLPCMTNPTASTKHVQKASSLRDRDLCGPVLFIWSHESDVSKSWPVMLSYNH